VPNFVFQTHNQYKTTGKDCKEFRTTIRLSRFVCRLAI